MRSINYAFCFHQLVHELYSHTKNFFFTLRLFSLKSRMPTPIAEIVKSGICRTSAKGISRPYPSLFFYPGLNSQPIHSADKFPQITTTLKQNFDIIRKEYLDFYKLHASDYTMQQDEHKLHNGQWEWNSYLLKGMSYFID